MTNPVKVFKLTSGEEVIAMIYRPVDEDSMVVQVEYPFTVEWDVDPESGYPYTELYPFVYASKAGQVVRIPFDRFTTAPLEPNQQIAEKYMELVEQVSEAAETRARANRPTQPKKRLRR